MDQVSNEERFSRAVEYEKTGDYMLALQEYVTLTQADQPLRPALINLGSLYSRMGQFDNAMTCYTRAMEMEEDYLSWFNIGSLHYKRTNYKQAVFSLQKSRKINSGFSLSVLVMGLSYSRLGNIRAAEKCFMDVLESHPDNEVALTGLAILCYDNNKLHQALDLTDRLLSLKPVNTGMKKLRSKILFLLGRNCESAEMVKSVREEDGGFRGFDSFVQSVPVEVFDDRLGSIDDKIEKLEEQLSESEKSGDMIALSLCYLFKGNPDKAIDCLFKAKEINS
jgi:tetratricopeptide (TPR) repeat protein